MSIKLKENAITVGVSFQKDVVDLSTSMEELARLADTAGATVVGSITQQRDKPDIRSYIGKGKLEELCALVVQTGANLVIVDNELHPSHIRNIEDETKVKVIDRTELILDIFAQHASSHEGRLQVELAQSVFSLTRLTGKGVTMSRLGGGIGTRGPGETKLEQDRRKIRKRISELKKDIEVIRGSRNLRRGNRRSSGIKTASIIGYTNSGKSTLLNTMTKSDVLVENKLFATVDTTTRKLFIDNKTILISDTVGFIQKLPHQLVDAFKATLEEVADSDVLIHVVDCSNPHFESQISAVYTVLEEIGAISKPIITAFNKIDLLKEPISKSVEDKYKPYVEISALKKQGFDALKQAIADSIK